MSDRSDGEARAGPGSADGEPRTAADGWGTTGVGLLVALFVIAALATVHSIWHTFLR